MEIDPIYTAAMENKIYFENELKELKEKQVEIQSGDFELKNVTTNKVNFYVTLRIIVNIFTGFRNF